MTDWDLLLIVGGVLFALAALAVWRGWRATRRLRQAGSRVSFGLIMRGVLVIVLLGLGVASLAGLHALPSQDMVNRPAPVAADTLVVFVQNNRDDDLRTVEAVSAQDGSGRWTRQLSDSVEKLYRPTPDLLLAELYGTGLVALRWRDGAIVWQSNIGRGGPSGALATRPLAVDGDRVYLTVPANPELAGAFTADLVALDIRTGAVVWRIPLPSALATSPDLPQPQALAAGDGLVMVGGMATNPGSLYPTWEITALRAMDGLARWVAHSPTGMQYSARPQSMLFASGCVIVKPVVGPLAALDERDGTIAWSGPMIPAGANPETALNDVVANGQTLYVMSHTAASHNDGTITNYPTRLMSLVARSGSVLWSRSLDPYLQSGALRLSDGVLLNGANVTAATGWLGYASNRSLLTAYDATNGAPLWSDHTPPRGVSWSLSDQIAPAGGDGVVFLMGIGPDPFVADQLTGNVLSGVSWLYVVNAHTGTAWWRHSTGYATLFHLTY